jgi:hypothetical protein
MQDPAGRSMMVTSAATQLTPNTQRLGLSMFRTSVDQFSVDAAPPLSPFFTPAPNPPPTTLTTPIRNYITLITLLRTAMVLPLP